MLGPQFMPFYAFLRDDSGNAATSGGFLKQNGIDLQKLNALFVSIQTRVKVCHLFVGWLIQLD